MTQDQHGRSTAGDQPPSATAAEFDQEFATVAGSSGLRRVWQAASPDLPQEIEPYSFVSVGLLVMWPTLSASRLGRHWSTWAAAGAVLGCGWPRRAAPG